MLFFHPVFQFAGMLLAFYVFFLGLNRFRVNHLGQKAVFPWKRHVTMGSVALLALLSGMAGGFLISYVYWGALLTTGTHSITAIAMVPFFLFGIGSGLYMNARKEKRKFLPLIHGINNLILLGFGLSQLSTGWMILRYRVLGG